MVFEVFGHLFTGIKAFLDFGVRDVTGHNYRTGQRQARFDRILRKLLADFIHRTVQVNLDHFVIKMLVRHLRKVLRRIMFEILDKDTVLGDLAQNLTVGRARNTQTNRAACPVARQTDHTHIVAEVLAAELCADAHFAGHLKNLLFPFKVTIGLTMLATFGRKVVVITR